jgi:hypothetical protein
MARTAANALFAHGMYRVHFREADEPTDFTLGDQVSGAMICGAVERAKLSAIHRDMGAGGTPSGIREDDLTGAVETIYRENVGFHHAEAIREFAEARGCTVASVQCVRREEG